MMHVYSNIPHKWLCKCLRPKGRQLQVIEKYEQLRNEISIVKILQQLRVLNFITKKKLGQKSWKAAVTRKSYQFYDEEYLLSDFLLKKQTTQL